MKKKDSKSMSANEPPRGREAAKTAILNAAEQLLAVKSPNKISIREIAEIAGVKHPIIHRYFGTKDELVTAVHTRAMERASREVASIGSVEGMASVFIETARRNKVRQTTIARALLDGTPPEKIQTEFPVIRRILQLLRERKKEKGFTSDVSPEAMTLFLTSAALGWLIHERFLLLAVELDEDKLDQMRAEVEQVLNEVVAKIC